MEFVSVDKQTGEILQIIKSSFVPPVSEGMRLYALDDTSKHIVEEPYRYKIKGSSIEEVKDEKVLKEKIKDRESTIIVRKGIIDTSNNKT